jgi:small multidrug resistance pump
MSWLWLLGAIIFEVLGTTSLKISFGMSKLIPSICVFLFYGLSFVALSIALKTLDISIAYAIWAGLGTAAIAVIGFIYFGEDINTVKILSILLIVLGVIGLNLTSKVH